MKILVIDDSNVHREAAQQQLGDHALVVVGTYDEGCEILCGRGDFQLGFFDAVLVDLLMPPSRRQQSAYKEYQEMPVGIFLALLAAKAGAKYVAVFTDSDHHSHPASTCFDDFNPDGERRPTAFKVENAKVILTNNRSWVRRGGEKRWHQVLDYLLNGYREPTGGGVA